MPYNRNVEGIEGQTYYFQCCYGDNVTGNNVAGSYVTGNNVMGYDVTGNNVAGYNENAMMRFQNISSYLTATLQCHVSTKRHRLKLAKIQYYDPLEMFLKHFG